MYNATTTKADVLYDHNFMRVRWQQEVGGDRGGSAVLYISNE